MKHMCEELEGFKIYFRQYDIEDLVEGLEYLPEVSKAGLNREQIKQVAFEFYKTMCMDIIMNNNEFVLPEKGFGMIHIKNIADVNHKDYGKHLQDNNFDSVLNQPVIAGRDITKKTKRVWIVRFNGAMQELFKRQVTINHHY